MASYWLETLAQLGPLAEHKNEQIDLPIAELAAPPYSLSLPSSIDKGLGEKVNLAVKNGPDFGQVQAIGTFRPIEEE